MENDTDTTEQVNIDSHKKTSFSEVIVDASKTGGLNAVAFKGHGKTRFLFCIASELMKQPNVKVLIWDSSDAWLYGFNKVAVFNVCDNDITAKEKNSSFDMEKYQLNNWQLVKFALDHNKDLLFRMKTRNPRKRAFFVRSIINYLDTLQRQEKEQNPKHENSKSLAFFLEEAQNIFSSHGTSSGDMAEFLSVFNEGRNFKESFFTACQRLNDFSKTIRTKQLQLIGKLSPEDLTPYFRKLEKKLGIEFANMPQRTWLYSEKLFISPEFKQQGKPYIINRSNREAFNQTQPQKIQVKPKESILHRIRLSLMLPNQRVLLERIEQKKQQPVKSLEKDITEDSEGDGLFISDSADDLFFPSEEP
jgi:hypothetical protein